MKTIFHAADDRGHANHGWLDAHHSFSFAGFYNPERTNFGALRVLNDDIVAASKGFGSHPHDNMEIITIPLTGELEHKDNMGNQSVIKSGDVQVMSAGTGVYHSEYNPSEADEVNLLQIWVFPNKKNVTPRYQQITLGKQTHNELHQILSPSSDDDGVWIHQNAWFHLGRIDQGHSVDYSLKDSQNNGVYTMILEGEVEINDQKLGTKDAIGIWEAADFEVTAKTDARILLIEVPLKF
ncbi:pirin family protein [Reichenbachiella sp. MSK19-1]|uniref:pirin family protein n=1 Tax=Reichenbachiella sp. MSK19-1 TaxID=1897631 RepID=UPI000ED5C1FC|nr:pirin family protein [Reichenbachiella sp. MSK19-1]RJE74814.1 hypothetical protein BGP76_16950 [Reichenbachiella sp. MSK19-1]